MTDTKRTRVYYAGRQWYVTDFGLECLKPYHYDIAAGRLGEVFKREGGDAPEAEWLVHMGDKTWLDAEDFIAAFAVALAVHQGRYSQLPEGAFLNGVGQMRASKAEDALHNELFPPSAHGSDVNDAGAQMFAVDAEFTKRFPERDAFREVAVEWPSDPE